MGVLLDGEMAQIHASQQAMEDGRAEATQRLVSIQAEAEKLQAQIKAAKTRAEEFRLLECRTEARLGLSV